MDEGKAASRKPIKKITANAGLVSFMSFLPLYRWLSLDQNYTGVYPQSCRSQPSSIVNAPDIVEQLHAPKSVFTGLFLKMRRSDIAHGNFFGEAAVLFIRFRMDGEKPDVVGLHVVLFDESMPQRCRRRT